MLTLNGKIILTGKGLHTGNECKLTIEPCIRSADLLMCSGGEECPLPDMKTNGTNRGSDYIFPSGQVLRTCEHVLSALAGMGMYAGLRLIVEGGEMPALDGCGLTLCNEIQPRARETGIFIPPLTVKYPVIVSNEDKTRFIAAFPANEFHITYTVEYDGIGTQIYDYGDYPGEYMREIAGARTFAYERDIEYLRSHGMALGGSLDNAILIGEGGKITANGGLRWENEFVRHKVLDLIGDLASIGRPLNAHIIAVRAGHELHLKLAEKLKGVLAIA